MPDKSVPGENIDALVSQLIRADVRAMSAYHVQDATGLLKLDAMENPNSWPGDLQAAWLESLRNVEANRYPAPDAPAVKAALRNAMGIPVHHDMLLGNGSDEIIQMLIQAVATNDAVVMAPEPGFVMYRILAMVNRLRYVGVPLDKDFGIDIEKFMAAMREHKPALVFLAQPNNPTGNLWNREHINQIVAQAPGLVVIDEAYVAFTDADFMDFLDRPNVLVMRTLSKMGLAGLRLGLLVGNPGWIKQVDKLRLPYNINVLTQASVVFALRHYAALQVQAGLIRQERLALQQGLEALPGIRVFPSEANFILISLLEKPAKTVFDGLKEKGILIKHFEGHPVLGDCLRLTVGLAAENIRLLQAMKEITT